MSDQGPESPRGGAAGRGRFPPAPAAGTRQRTPRMPAQPPAPDQAPGGGRGAGYTRYRAEPHGGRGRGHLPRITPKRAVLGVLGLILGWVLLSLILFLVSSHFNRVAPPANVAGELEGAGFPLTSATNILVLGSDRREKNSR